MLQVYMDDSGSHDMSHNCVVGGYWGDVATWADFEKAWTAILAVYEIEEFKSAKFWARNRRVPPYEGWSDAKAQVFLNAIMIIIQGSSVCPFASGVLRAEWEKQPIATKYLASGAKEPRLLKSLFMPLHKSIYRCVSYCPPDKTMHFVFDENSDKKLKILMIDCFDGVKEFFRDSGDQLADRMGGLSFEDGKKCPQLQAADLLAFQAHRYAIEADGKPNHPMPVEYARAILNYRSREDFWLFDGPRFDDLESTLRRVDEEIRQGS